MIESSYLFKQPFNVLFHGNVYAIGAGLARESFRDLLQRFYVAIREYELVAGPTQQLRRCQTDPGSRADNDHSLVS